LLFAFIGILAFIGFLVYSTVMNITTQTKKKMAKKHVTVSRVGMKVGVKELNDEDYKDRSQRYVDESCSFLEWNPEIDENEKENNILVNGDVRVVVADIRIVESRSDTFPSKMLTLEVLTVSLSASGIIVPSLHTKADYGVVEPITKAKEMVARLLL
jgi:hypothetical protein